MAEAILVRHAATAWTGRRYCGRSDPPLGADGVAAASRLAAALGPSLPPGIRIVSSPLLRARQTAAAIASVVSPVFVDVDDRWAETDFGIAEGLTFDELARLAPDLAERVAAGELDIDWPGGEPAAAMAARVETAWRDLASRQSPALVVSHGGPIRVAIALGTARPPSEIAFPMPASIWRVNLPVVTVRPAAEG